MQRCEARARVRAELLRCELDSLVFVRERAIERVRAARAPLIDEHDIPLALHACECRCGKDIEVRRRLAGAARQYEQRIRGTAPIERGNHGDLESDAPSSGMVAVFRHCKHAAASLDRLQVIGVLQAALVERERGNSRGRRERGCRTTRADDQRAEAQAQLGLQGSGHTLCIVRSAPYTRADSGNEAAGCLH